MILLSINNLTGSTALTPSMPMLLLLGGGIALAVLCFMLVFSGAAPTHPAPRPRIGAASFYAEPVIDSIHIPEPPGILRRWGIPAEAAFDLIVGADGRIRKIGLVWCSHATVTTPLRKAIKGAAFSPAVGTEGEPVAVWVRVVLNMNDAAWDLICLGTA